jgi:quercetin dioxygenase-like cupin family protein
MLSLASLGVGLLAGAMVSDGRAQTTPPTEHRGVSLVKLGVVPEASLEKTIGLSGYIMQLREITLEPGGQIAKHSHATRPGLVQTISGSWTEGSASGERDYPASEQIAIVEDEATEHWFFNNEAEPVKVVVCDIVPPS